MLRPSQRLVLLRTHEPQLTWQYVDVLVAATYSDDGSLGTACSSLAMRLREQNGVVSFFISLALAELTYRSYSRLS
jgi:hypothetical protein